MIQIIIAVMGIAALIKGRVKVTHSRFLSATRARIVGALLLAAACVPMVIADGLIGMAAMIGLAFLCTGVAFAMSEVNELADEIPMNAS